MDSTSSEPAVRTAGAAGSARSPSSGASSGSSSPSSPIVSSMSSIATLPFGSAGALYCRCANLQPPPRTQAPQRARARGWTGYGRRSDAASGGRQTETETFGAAAPGRRVLYSASWVLHLARPPKRSRRRQGNPGVDGCQTSRSVAARPDLTARHVPSEADGEHRPGGPGIGREGRSSSNAARSACLPGSRLPLLVLPGGPVGRRRSSRRG